MRAEIISIGSELVSGQSLDTNSQWLSRELSGLGISIGLHTTLGDILSDHVAVFRGATERADLVVVTGGLGPTQDDLTREALAQSAGVGLVEHAESLAAIAAMFARRNRVMTERNRTQAFFPKGQSPSQPGWHGSRHLDGDRRGLICLPSRRSVGDEAHVP